MDTRLVHLRVPCEKKAFTRHGPLAYKFAPGLTAMLAAAGWEIIDADHARAPYESKAWLVPAQVPTDAALEALAEERHARETQVYERWQDPRGFDLTWWPRGQAWEPRLIASVGPQLWQVTISWTEGGVVWDRTLGAELGAPTPESLCRHERELLSALSWAPTQLHLRPAGPDEAYENDVALLLEAGAEVLGGENRTYRVRSARWTVAAELPVGLEKLRLPEGARLRVKHVSLRQQDGTLEASIGFNAWTWRLAADGEVSEQRREPFVQRIELNDRRGFVAVFLNVGFDSEPDGYLGNFDHDFSEEGGGVEQPIEPLLSRFGWAASWAGAAGKVAARLGVTSARSAFLLFDQHSEDPPQRLHFGPDAVGVRACEDPWFLGTFRFKR